jgi:scavenger receptor class B protein 1
MYKTQRAWLLWLLFVPVGVFFAVTTQAFFDIIMHMVMDLNPGTILYNYWVESMPYTVDIYFFNWTNPEDVYNPNIKPRFEQVGPYRYTEIRKKINLQYFENDTLSFAREHWYYFKEHESPKNPKKDVITTVNIIALIAAQKFKYKNYWVKQMLNLGFSASQTKVYTTHTVEELLFSGYEDKLLNMVRPGAIFIPGLAEFDKFAFFYKRNGSIFSGDVNARIKYTGVEGGTFGEYVTWNNNNVSSFYTGNCQKVQGGLEDFPQRIKNDTRLRIFSPEMCTYLDFDYVNDEYLFGLSTKRFGSRLLFDNGTEDKEYSCYCKGECQPRGLLNTSECTSGAPLFTSLPHFYNADPYYTNLIDGMQPDKEKHDFYLNYDHRNGLIIYAAGRFQLNALVDPVPHVNIMKNLTRFYAPILFIEEIMYMPGWAIGLLFILQNLTFVMVTFGMGLIILGVYKAAINYINTQRDYQSVKMFKVALENRVRRVSDVGKNIEKFIKTMPAAANHSLTHKFDVEEGESLLT